jgi:hypothetical protein
MLTMCFALAIAVAAHAQEFKIAKTTGTLEVTDVNDVTIEPATGNEIIFTSRDHHDDDDRAKGLRAVSNMGFEDNTGIGLSVVDKGSVIEVHQLKKMDGPEIIIQVPKGIIVSYRHSSPYGSGFKVRNIENQLNVSTVHNEVELDNVTGPLDIKTVHGEINAALGSNVKGPVSIASVHGHVDVGLPVATNASLKLNTSWGDIFVDPELKVEMNNSKDGMVTFSDNFSGKMNAGGIDIDLSSTHSNVYLRKK